MINVPAVAVAESAEELEGKPSLFDVLQEWPGAQPIIEGVVEELPSEVPVRFRFDNPLVPEGIRDVCQGLSFACVEV